MDVFRNRRAGLLAAAAFVLMLFPLLIPFSHAADPDSLEEKILKGADDDLKKTGHQGHIGFELVGVDGKPIEPQRYVRGIPGQFTVSEFPRSFALEGHNLFEAGGQRLNTQLAQGGATVFCDAPADADGESARYASRSSANLPTGKYSIDPFGLTFDVGPGITATHPALAVQGTTVRIRTAPVIFRAVDAKTGQQIPLTGFQLFCGKADLLKDLLDTKDALGFNPLTLYLPVATSYQSSLGAFSIDEAGAIKPAAGVPFEGGAFIKKVDSATAVPVAQPIGKGYWVASQNLRRVYKRGENAPFIVIGSGTLPAAKLPVIATGAAGEVVLGELGMPAIAGTDSRLFLLQTISLAPGKYQLSVKAADAHPFGIEVVDLLPTTPLFLFTVNACGESDFTLDSAGLDQLRDTGVRSWTTYGFGGALDPKVEGKVPYPAAPADAPPELRRPVSDARALLDDCLRHGLVTIDFENRRLGWYNEGLAYHHSHPMSVDRMVRRVQIFGQELGDYPAFAGLSYTWFPALGGYTEGGVATDPFFATRMEVLRANVKKETGFEPLSPKEWQQWQAAAKTPAGIPQDLADKHRNYWRAEQHMGFYDGMALYNRKLREVNRDFIATTACNAGHDGGIRVADLCSTHDAMTWESYTDFGDWPLSAGFCADWTHGEAPGKAQWQQIEPSQSDPAIIAKQIIKLARGVEGIGTGVHAPTGARSNARRARGNKFLERYGSLVTAYQPDMTVAVCVNELDGGAEYQAHAIHSHLTRLGYGPQVISEETIEKAVPAGVKLIVIPNCVIPFSGDFQKNLKAFMAGGGKVLLIGENCRPIEGATRVTMALKQLWDVGGFAAHQQFWEEFERVRPTLEKAMGDLGFAPINGAAPDKALILPMMSAGVRYVAVTAAAKGTRDTVFTPVQGVTVKVGAAARVVNLVTGETLPVANGNVALNFVSEPAALLALLDIVPTAITLHYPADVIAGQSIELATGIGPTVRVDGGIPVQYVIKDAAGKQRAVFYQLSGPTRGVRYAIPATEIPGDFSVSATDLITGLTATAIIKVKPPATVNAVAEAAPVYIPHPDRIPLFLSRQGEVRVVVEETQSREMTDAERLVAALRKSGRAATVEKIEPGSYDGLKLRWFPTKHEDDLLAKVDAGQVIGYRIDLRSYVSASSRAHIPEKGGWADLKPSYVIRNDVILFSGGKLADSLRAVSDWLPTPDMPGKGNGVLEVSLSPFWADRDALTVIANDDAGRARGVDRLLEFIESHGKLETSAAIVAPAGVPAAAQVTGTEHSVLDLPLKGFVPSSLVTGLTASANGYAVVQSPRATFFVAPDGTLIKILPNSALPAAVTTGGTYFGGRDIITRIDPSWNFATNWKINVVTADSKGQTFTFDLPPEVDWMGDRYHGWDAGYAVSADGKTYFAGQAEGGFSLFDLEKKTYRSFPYDVKQLGYFEAGRAPRFVCAAAFSPDGQFVAYAIAHHPSGYGGMGSPPASPYGSSIRLVRVATGEIVWQQEAANLRDGSFGAEGKSLAVCDKGERVAMIDWNQNAVIFDRAGKELFRKPLFDWKKRYGSSDGRTNHPSLRVEMTRDGSTILFASGDVVLITDGTGAPVANIDATSISDVRLALDGQHAYLADTDGLITCADRKGTQVWSAQTQGDNPKLAATSQGVLVAEGAGNLLILDGNGAVLRRTPLLNASTPEPPAPTLTAITITGPALYHEPQTLSVLQKYGAKSVAQWQPQGEAAPAFGRKFYRVPAEANVTLSASGKEMHLVHMVYRHHAAAGAGPTVTLASGGKERSFILDMPTPEYRIVDLPCEEKQDLLVTIKPADQLEIAELSVYTIAFPGTNSVYIKPAGIGLEHSEGLDLTSTKKEKPDDAEILDDKDPSQVARAAAGKMKNTAIYSRNPDPDQVEGHYIRATGNPLETIDGRKFLDGKPSPWTKAEASPWGSTFVIDLNHRAQPKLCAVYERTLRQSEVMKVVVVMRGAKGDMDAASGGPDKLAIERRGVGGVLDNDQFFNVFDTAGVEMDALGVYVYSGRGKDYGVSEIELYE